MTGTSTSGVAVLGDNPTRKEIVQNWNPEDAEFWQKFGKKTATRNLVVSIITLLITFCINTLAAQVAAQLGNAGFSFSSSDLFLLTALPGLVGATGRLVYTYLPARMGGRNFTFVFTAILLIRRRFGIKRMKANTSKMDIVLYMLMTLTIVLGICATFSNADGSFEYRLSLTPWVRSIFIGQPLVAQMAISPLIYKAHIFCGLTFFAVLPFTCIVHMFSGITAGFKYVGRKAIVYRRRKIDERALRNERAPEFSARVTPSDK